MPGLENEKGKQLGLFLMAAVHYGFRESRFFKFKVGLSLLDCQSVGDCPCELGLHVQAYQKRDLLPAFLIKVYFYS